MKRLQDRDTPPKQKRGRLGYLGPDNNDLDQLSVDSERRDGRVGRMGRDGGKNHREPRDRDFGEFDNERMQKRHKDDSYGHAPRQDRVNSGPEFRTLCISNFPMNIYDGMIREALEEKFKKFGEFNIKLSHQLDHKIAYLNFRYGEDARNAKHARSKLTLFDRQMRVDTVFSKRPRSPSPEFMQNSRDMYHGNRNRSASPVHSMGNRRNDRHGSMGRDLPPRDLPPPRSVGGGSIGPPSDRGSDMPPFPPQNNRRLSGERFPHHLEHILPEDDDKATRTLFVGNLDHNITEPDLRRIFEKYGVVEDIDIKKPTRNQGNPYAFVKFINLDMAHRAKVEMSGQYIGNKCTCKIGYGKVNPSTCLWIGGIGPWVRTETLEREFDRFGVINRINWPQGKNYAYVLYDSIDAAQAACQEMRGFPMGGSERRLRVDFADPTHIDSLPTGRMPMDERGDGFGSADIPHGFERDNRSNRNERGFDNQWQGNKVFDNRGGAGRGRKDWGPPADEFQNNPGDPRDLEFERFRRGEDINMPRGRGMPHERRGKFGRGGYHNERNRTFSGGDNGNMIPRMGGEHSTFSDFGRSFGDRDVDRHGNNFHHSPPPRGGKRGRRLSPADDRMHMNRERNNNTDIPHNNNSNNRTHAEGNGILPMSNVDHVTNVEDLSKCLPVVWSGALVLKNSAFAARMHLVSGDVSLVDTLMRDTTTTEMPVLRITQRLRLDPPKLEEVGRRVATSGPSGHSILLAMPGSAQTVEESNTNIQQRPLRNLVSYLKQKEAAGVITLPPNPSKEVKDNTGVLYGFPPCQFGQDFLHKRASKLITDSKEDHLVVVVVRADGV